MLFWVFCWLTVIWCLNEASDRSIKTFVVNCLRIANIWLRHCWVYVYIHQIHSPVFWRYFLTTSWNPPTQLTSFIVSASISAQRQKYIGQFISSFNDKSDLIAHRLVSRLVNSSPGSLTIYSTDYFFIVNRWDNFKAVKGKGTLAKNVLIFACLSFRLIIGGFFHNRFFTSICACCTSLSISTFCRSSTTSCSLITITLCVTTVSLK